MASCRPRPPALLGAILLASALVSGACSSDEDAAPVPQTVADISVGEHLHEVFGVYACGEWAPPLADAGPDVSGIHGHGDGLIHTHPFSAEFAGRGATLGAFFASVGVVADEDSIELPDGRQFETGESCLAGEEEAEVRLLVDGDVVGGDPSELRLSEDRTIVLAFGPPDEEVPEPPWVDELQAPSDVALAEVAPSP